MIDLRQIRDEVVRPLLKYLNHVDPGQWSIAAEQLLLGTLVVESGGRYIRQLGGGPARSLYQIEPKTAKDVRINFLQHKPRLAGRIESIVAPWPNLDRQLLTNRNYSAAIARQCYRRQKPALPPPGDAQGLADYWKRYYNTAGGAGDPAKFVRRFNKYVRPLYG